MKREEKIMWLDLAIDPQIKADLERCWEEAKGAELLSDEELDKIIKEVRREIRNERVSVNEQGRH